MHGRQAGHAAVCFREYFIVTDSNRPAYHLIFNPFFMLFCGRWYRTAAISCVTAVYKNFTTTVIDF